MPIISGIVASSKSGHIGPSVTTTNATLFSDATYYYQAYLSTGTFTNALTVSGGSVTADILVVAGGGAGFYELSSPQYLGGGGAGGVQWLTSQVLTSGSYNITVGAGGQGGQTGFIQYPGGNSQFGALTASVGGGAGGSGTILGQTGGSGGGSSGSGHAGGSGTSGQGNAGGAGGTNTAGGGGGYGGAGNTNSNGGAGSTSSSAFYSTVLACGINSGLIGGGGGGCSISNPGTATAGGGGGGASATAAVANTGGGGYSAYNQFSTSGGSGVIIVRYTRTQVGG